MAHANADGIGTHENSSKMQELARDINLLAEFLANEQVNDIYICSPVDCIIICGSSIIFQAEVLFRALEERPSLAKIVILVGGVGHSTQLLYDAINRHEKFSALSTETHGLPEARVMEIVLRRFFDYEKITSQGCQVLIEDQSTNCGSNAIEAIKLLRTSNLPEPKSFIIIQDPTMSLRTSAGFRNLYQDHPSPPTFNCCPVFVPRVRSTESGLEYDVRNAPSYALWSKDRFYSLLVGEIPRLRDDEDGYGPKGRAFITHVDVPTEIESAWNNLREASGSIIR